MTTSVMFTIKLHLHRYGLLVPTAYNYKNQDRSVNVRCACGKDKRVKF